VSADAAFFSISGDLDLLQQVQDFVVIGRQYVDDILINRRRSSSLLM
jgi:hypothetical protein